MPGGKKGRHDSQVPALKEDPDLNGPDLDDIRQKDQKMESRSHGKRRARILKSQAPAFEDNTQLDPTCQGGQIPAPKDDHTLNDACQKNQKTDSEDNSDIDKTCQKHETTTPLQEDGKTAFDKDDSESDSTRQKQAKPASWNKQKAASEYDSESDSTRQKQAKPASWNKQKATPNEVNHELDNTRQRHPKRAAKKDQNPASRDDTDFNNTLQKHQKTEAKAHRKRRASNTQHLSFGQYAVPIAYWFIDLLGLVFRLLKLPIALVLSISVILYMLIYSFAPATEVLCSLPFGIGSRIVTCNTTHQEQLSDEFNLDIIEYGAKLQHLQRFAADSHQFVYGLSLNEGSIRNMIYRLSTVKNLSSRYVFCIDPDPISHNQWLIDK